jgi:hypothetical protein
MATINELKWATLTATVNEIKSPNQFLRRLLFSNHQPVSTEDIEIGLLTKAREIAPFVKKNGEAKMVGGHSESYQTVSPTNIRIKRPFTPSELLYNRRPGSTIFIESGEQLSAIEQHIARDLQVMSDLITNAEEYLCALALQGTISYVNEDEDAFTITFPRSGGHTITLSTFWDDATPADVRMEADVFNAKKLLSDAVGLPVTDCILGSEAVTEFQALIARGDLKVLDQRNVTGGVVTFLEQFNQDGAIFLGEAFGIRWWAYPRTASLNGSSVNMIRPKYAEFVSASPASDRVLYYGAIPDMDALEGRRFVGERFSKSWRENDPSAMMALIHSRPLPVPRRPDATVSMKVVSG